MIISHFKKTPQFTHIYCASFCIASVEIFLTAPVWWRKILKSMIYECNLTSIP
jgi:hypothetical protein